MAGGFEVTLKIGMTVVEMWIIDRLGGRAGMYGWRIHRNGGRYAGK